MKHFIIGRWPMRVKKTCSLASNPFLHIVHIVVTKADDATLPSKDTLPYPKIRTKKCPMVPKNPRLCGLAAGVSATAPGPVLTVGPNPGAGSEATVAALSGVAMPSGVPTGTARFGAI